MFKDRYNYKLNGIEHEIILNNNIKIDMKPIDEKILISNKFMLKYINDLFDYYNIEYFIINNVLLGSYVFNGVNIFQKNLELATLSINLHKIKKIEEDLKNDDFQISYYDNNYIKITTTFLKKYKTSIYIYLVNHNSDDDTIIYKLYNNIDINHKFYDIYPIKKEKFEEYTISVPNKIENVLLSYNFNLNYIVFSNKKDEVQNIIEEKLDTTYYEKFISIIKPYFF
jgi:hypothetical protein